MVNACASTQCKNPFVKLSSDIVINLVVNDFRSLSVDKCYFQTFSFIYFFSEEI